MWWAPVAKKIMSSPSKLLKTPQNPELVWGRVLEFSCCYSSQSSRPKICCSYAKTLLVQHVTGEVLRKIPAGGGLIWDSIWETLALPTMDWYWIGLRENLQATHGIFPLNMEFSCKLTLSIDPLIHGPILMPTFSQAPKSGEIHLFHLSPEPGSHRRSVATFERKKTLLGNGRIA